MASVLKKRWLRGVLVLIVLLAGAVWFLQPEPPPPIRGSGQPMQAIVYHEYGPADVLKLEQTEKPLPNDNQLVLKVRAAAVNPLDWHYMRGTPYLMRMQAGMRRPLDTRLGTDVAGVVEAVGKDVTEFKVGDEVFGTSGGAFAEYALVSRNKVVAKPANITFEQAAGVPIAALTALQALRDKGRVQPGKNVLINGASGGVGTFAVQLAKHLGAEVTGVCSTRNVELVKSLGADHVIDYTKEDFTASKERYDVIIDNVGTQPLGQIRRVLTKKGTLVMVGGGGPDDGNWIGPMGRPVQALLMSPFIDQDQVMILAEIEKSDLELLRGLLANGTVKTVVDRTYPMSETAAAVRYLEAGHARGKVIITMAQ